MRPLHKWKTFWLGILILAFLLWAWSRGRSHDDHVGAHIGTKTCYYLHNSEGYIAWYTQTDHSPRPPIYRFDHESSPSTSTAPWFPPPLTKNRYTIAHLTGTDHGISHWLLTLLFLITWSALLLWRSRRIRCLTTPSQQADLAP